MIEQWFDRVGRWWRWRGMNRKMLGVIEGGQGVGAKVWPILQPLERGSLEQIRQEARDFLDAMVSASATPYGYNRCSVFFGLAEQHGDQRTPLWKTTLPSFSKDEREQSLAAVDAALAALPLTDYPTANQLEVYMMDVGFLFREAISD